MNDDNFINDQNNDSSVLDNTDIQQHQLIPFNELDQNVNSNNQSYPTNTISAINMNSNLQDQQQFVGSSTAQYYSQADMQNSTPDIRIDSNIKMEPPKLPDELYLTAINDHGLERQSNKQSQHSNRQNINQIQIPQDANNQVDNSAQNLYSEEEIENFRCIFDMFDKEKTGCIDVADLQTIMRSLGRDPHEALELLQGLELSQENKLSFQEFLKIMKTLENRLITGKNNNDEQSPREADLEERNKYGSLLPRTGVHFLPDSKVVDLLKILNDHRKNCIKQMKLAEAVRAQLKFDDLKAKETLRQMQNMRQAQEQELITVENAQRAQFLEFSQAWDNYMSDYEATAYLSLEKLKEKHILEVQQLHEQIRKEYKVKLKLTKELMEMRKQVQTLISLKRYEEADALNTQCNEQEQQEKQQMESQIDEQIQKAEERLRAKQQLALAALLKRIQRDRNEQLKHRQIDSQRLIQRNKNLLLDLLNKQNMETRRTNQFLKFALGVRSPDRKNYYKSKLFTAPEDTKLKIAIGNTSGDENSRTMYNNMGSNNKTNTSFAAIKNQSYNNRAKTSYVDNGRSMSMEMTTAAGGNTNDSINKSYTRGAQRISNLKNSSNMGNTTNNSMFQNNRSSVGNKTRGSDDNNNTVYGNNFGNTNGIGLNQSQQSNKNIRITSQKEVKLPQIRQ